MSFFWRFFVFKLSAKEEDQLVRSEGRQSVDETMKCKFGGHELLIGDKVTDKNKCIDCECVIPPMITCVQRRNCWEILNYGI